MKGEKLPTFVRAVAVILVLVTEMKKAKCMKVEDAMAMVLVARLESGENDPLAKALTESMQAAQKAISSKVDPNAIEESFVRRIKDIVSANGIDVVLPLDCGRNVFNSRNPLVPKKNPFPWIAALGSREQGLFHFRCTGIIIHESHILTDGNCVASPTINVVRLNVTTLPGIPAVENFVVGRRLHPSIRSKSDLLAGINIGILELAYPLKFNAYVQPACIPGLLDEDSARQTKRFQSTLVGFRNIEDGSRGRSGNLFLMPNSTTDFAPKCVLEIKAFNKMHPNRMNSLDNLLTEDHICVYRNYEMAGKSLVVQEMEAAGARRVKVIGLGGFANARTPVPIAYTSVQSHRFWIELVIKKFRDNTFRKPGQRS